MHYNTNTIQIQYRGLSIMCMIAPSWSSEMLTGARALVTSMFTWFYVCTNPIYMVRIVIIVIIVIIHVSSIQISQQFMYRSLLLLLFVFSFLDIFVSFCFVDWIGLDWIHIHVQSLIHTSYSISYHIISCIVFYHFYGSPLWKY